jgi:uncharacterized protein YdeI (YjbR/CyaY-like superfamily)
MDWGNGEGMGERDSRVDAYIAKAAPFARPVLVEIREAVHAGCPDVCETMKWSVPFFESEGPLCMMAAFKAHARFGFWKGALLRKHGWSPDELAASGEIVRITSVSDLPARAMLIKLVKAAAKLNASGVKAPKPRASKKPATATSAVAAPAPLKAALAKNAAARATFAAFSPSHRREYVNWITEAKTDETRARRVAAAILQMADGKARHWKYQRQK